MSERLVIDDSVVEAESASEASAAAMGAAACVSCVGCPLMQRCILPQAIEARAREVAGEAESHESTAETPAEIDYAAALLDEEGPVVVWAQGAVPAAPEPALSEEVLPAPSITKYEEEAAEPREVPSPSYAISLSTLWEMPVAKPGLEPVLECGSAANPELALHPNPDPVLATDSDPVPPLDSDPVSELAVEREPDPVSEIGTELVPNDSIDVVPAAVRQEVRAAAERIETPAAPVVQTGIDIEPYAQVTIESAVEANREPVAEVSVEPVVEISTEPLPEVNAAPNTQTVEYRPVIAESVECGIPCQDPVASWVAVAHEEPAPPQLERVDEATLTAGDDGVVIVSQSADCTVEAPPVVMVPLMPDAAVTLGREDLASENEQPSLSAPLLEAPMQAERMPAGVNEHNTTNEEMGAIPLEAALSVAGDEEVVCDEVLLSPADVEMEEVDSRLGSEPYREALTKVVYNTTKRDDDTALTGRDSDHAESEAPNAGYGTSWLAALLGMVAVFTVVRRRSGAVY